MCSVQDACSNPRRSCGHCIGARHGCSGPLGSAACRDGGAKDFAAASAVDASAATIARQPTAQATTHSSITTVAAGHIAALAAAAALAPSEASSPQPSSGVATATVAAGTRHNGAGRVIERSLRGRTPQQRPGCGGRSGPYVRRHGERRAVAAVSSSAVVRRVR